jgi:hypothetical protein
LSRQCFSYGPTGQRCSQPADHEGDHYIQITWGDEDSVTPDHFAVARTVEARSVRPIPIVDNTVDDEPGMDKCAACGWPEDSHDQNTEGCKRFA